MKIGIMGALSEEISELIPYLTNITKSTISGKQFIEGSLPDPVVLCTSGVGKINATLTSYILISHFKVDIIIFTGFAGSLDPNLEIGDVVISDEVVQHDLDNLTPGLLSLGYLLANPGLIKMTSKVLEKLEVPYIVGKILSGDQFISDTLVKELLYNKFGGICVEMEGAPVGYVCKLNNIPFVIIRHISDKADSSAAVDFYSFAKQKSKVSAQIVKDLVWYINHG